MSKKKLENLQQAELDKIDSSKNENIESFDENKIDNLEEKEQNIVVTQNNSIEQSVFSQEYADEKLNEAMKSVAPKKRKKSIIISVVFLIINIIFMVIIVTGLLKNTEDSSSLIDVLKNCGNNLWWLAGGILMYGFFILIQVIMYYDLIKSLTGKKNLKLAYDVAVVGKYYDNVTPFAVGGQPLQMVRLSQGGLSAGVSTSIPIIKMIMNSFIHMFIALMCFIFGIPLISATSGLNRFILIIFVILGIIGLIVSLLVTLFMFLVSTGNFITRSFISGVLRFLYKMKLVKNYRQALRKTVNQVSEYRNSMKFLIKNKALFFKMIIYNAIECLSYAMLTYFVVRAFVSGAEYATFAFLLTCLTKYYICYMASCYIPLPGGTGMMEITFIFLFGIVVQNDIVWALLIWRIVSYYFILIHGFSNEVVHITKNLLTNKKKKEV